MSDRSTPATTGHTFDTPPIGPDSFERSPQPLVVVGGATHVVRYLNPSFARLVGRTADELMGRPFAESVPEGMGNGCPELLDRVFGTGVAENLAEREHRDGTAYWSYTAWATFADDGKPTGVIVQVTDSTETALFRRRAAEMNEALVLSSVRQHGLTAAAESLNAKLRDSHDRLEERVAERTAELAAANAALRAEIETREAAEADRRELIRRMATVQEDERRRISRNLHDQMGQLLTALGLGLKSLEIAILGPSQARPHLAKLRDLTNQIGREFHRLALDLRPTALDDLGLRAALANYAESWSERTGVEADFQFAGPDAERLPAAVETALYRVVQEAMTNVLRHAAARKVSIVLQFTRDRAVAVIEDDGAGFNAETVASPSGEKGRLGLIGMRERMAQVGGTLTVESAPARGTTVIARVPLSP